MRFIEFLNEATIDKWKTSELFPTVYLKFVKSNLYSIYDPTEAFRRGKAFTMSDREVTGSLGVAHSVLPTSMSHDIDNKYKKIKFGDSDTPTFYEWKRSSMYPRIFVQETKFKNTNNSSYLIFDFEMQFGQGQIFKMNASEANLLLPLIPLNASHLKRVKDQYFKIKK
jgi:hypothetical protein